MDQDIMKSNIDRELEHVDSGQSVYETNLVNSIAQLTHEVNRAFCAAYGDLSQVPWNDAPGWQRASARAGVKAHLDTPGLTAAQSHDNWLRIKIENGWVYGPVKDAELKTHPSMIPYAQLSEHERAKDALFSAVVDTASKLL